MMKIRELTLNDLHNNLLDDFNRYQEVKKCYRNENGAWVVKDISFTENWDEKRKEQIINGAFHHSIESGGCVFGVYNGNGKLIAFANLLSGKFGSRNQYIQLKQLHVSYEYRNQGMGKELFALCIQRAREKGAKKLYISASSAEETQCFYKSVGCTDAMEINRELFEKEPFDRHMEYSL
jgi:N-acetylglutamate synthase-like GNAT family acetyltransferase